MESAREELAGLRPQLLKIARRYGRSAADAEDLVQATLLKALIRCPRLRPGSNLEGWTRVILRNEAIDGIRRARARQHELRELRTLADAFEAPDRSSEPAPWEGLSSADVARALERCAPVYRDAFHLHHFAGLSYAQISELLEVPVPTVGTRLLRARSQLRRELMSYAVSRERAC